MSRRPLKRLARPDKAEAVEGTKGPPMDGIGDGPQRLASGVNEAENAQGSVGQGGESLGQAEPLGVVAIFVPPAVLDEVKAVFDLPVVTHIRLQAGCRHGGRIKAGEKIAGFVGDFVARAHLAIHREGNLAIGKLQTLAEIVGEFQVEP
jgi:hypothetical protein